MLPELCARQLRLGGGFDHRRPRLHVELVRLDRRISALEASEDPADAALVARVLRYLRDLSAEIDRVRPEARQAQSWECD